MRRVSSLLWCCALTALLAACGGGGGGSTPATTSSNGTTGTTTTPSVTSPVVTELIPSNAVEGSTVTVKGSRLESVQQVWVGSQQASGVQVDSATQLRFVVPTGAPSGAVRLVGSAGESTSTVTLSVLLQPSVSSLAPTQARAGDTLVFGGTQLDNVSQVLIGGVAVAPINRSSTRFDVVIPATAASPTVVLLLVDGSTRTSPLGFTLLPPAARVTGLSPSTATAGSAITLSGTNLTSTVRLWVGSTSVTITSLSASSLVFAAPASGGAVALEMTDGLRVNAGTLTVSAAPSVAVRIEQVEVAQTYSHLPNATYQALVPGKDAWLRAFVVADSAIAAPSVSATLNCASQPSLTFTGPTTLPTSLPAIVNTTSVFIAQVPAACVRTGLQANVTVAAGSRSSAVSRSVAPTVAGATNMHLVLVPLVANGGTGQVPAVGTVERLLTRIFPLAAGQIKISVRAPYTMSTTTVRTATEWDNALDELQTLWQAEGQGRHYFGVLADANYQGGTAGLGFRNARTNSTNRAWLVSLGLDAVAQPDAVYGTDAALTTMAHEIGHNLGLYHAPCGSVSNVDSTYPYASAGLGPNPVFESDSDRDGIQGPLAVYFPASPYTRDLMSYCRALWFSDYNFRNAQQFLETFSYPNVAAYARPQTLLDFQGSIGADQSVTMVAPSARVASQPALGSGDYTLRVVPTQGTAHDYPFQSVAVEDGAQPRAHFRVSVPDPGPIARVEVLYQGRSLPVQLNAPPVADALASGVSTPPEAQVQWEEKGGVLELRWDSARYPTLQVRHSDGAQSTVLAARLRGGSARLPLHSLPTGGQWEFSLSAQWNAQLVIGIRP